MCNSRPKVVTAIQLKQVLLTVSVTKLFFIVHLYLIITLSFVVLCLKRLFLWTWTITEGPIAKWCLWSKLEAVFKVLTLVCLINVQYQQITATCCNFFPVTEVWFDVVVITTIRLVSWTWFILLLILTPTVVCEAHVLHSSAALRPARAAVAPIPPFSSSLLSPSPSASLSLTCL